jgi:hypothetical protein
LDHRIRKYVLISTQMLIGGVACSQEYMPSSAVGMTREQLLIHNTGLTSCNVVEQRGNKDSAEWLCGSEDLFGHAADVQYQLTNGLVFDVKYTISRVDKTTTDDIVKILKEKFGDPVEEEELFIGRHSVMWDPCFLIIDQDHDLKFENGKPKLTMGTYRQIKLECIAP